MKKRMNRSHMASSAACAGAAFGMLLSLRMMDATILVSIILFILGIVAIVSMLLIPQVHTVARG